MSKIFSLDSSGIFQQITTMVTHTWRALGCCSISKDTNFSANHNTSKIYIIALLVLFNKQRYELFSKSQL